MVLVKMARKTIQGRGLEIGSRVVQWGLEVEMKTGPSSEYYKKKWGFIARARRARGLRITDRKHEG